MSFYLTQEPKSQVIVPQNLKMDNDEIHLANVNLFIILWWYCPIKNTQHIIAPNMAS